MLAMEFAGCSDMPDCSSSGSSSLTCQSPQFCIPIFHPRNYKNRVLASKIAPQACRVLPTSAYGICQMFGFPPPMVLMLPQFCIHDFSGLVTFKTSLRPKWIQCLRLTHSHLSPIQLAGYMVTRCHDNSNRLRPGQISELRILVIPEICFTRNAGSFR